jgi:hypothetical protein
VPIAVRKAGSAAALAQQEKNNLADVQRDRGNSYRFYLCSGK